MTDLLILFSSKLSFRQKWHYFRWPHPFFWRLLFRSRAWQSYVGRNLKDGYLEGGGWQRWIPGESWGVTFTGYVVSDGVGVKPHGVGLNKIMG